MDASASWRIDSPTSGAGPFRNDSGISCHGETEDAGDEWECRIKQKFPDGSTIESAMSGTSVLEDPDEDDAIWQASVPAPANNWAPRSNAGPATVGASVELTDLDTDNLERSVSISFEYNPR